MTIGLARRSCGYEKVTGLSSAKALTLPATGAGAALIQAEGKAVRWLDNGGTPSLTDGMQLPAGASMNYVGDLRRLLFVEESASATLQVIYYE